MVDFIVNQVVLDVSAVALLLGTILVLTGLFVMCVSFYVTDETYVTRGKIIGALERSRKRKRKNGSVKTDYSRNLIFEYQSPDGELRRGTSSEWSSSFTKLHTGERLDIRVIPRCGYDDIYMADRGGNVKFASVMMAIGLAIFLAATRSPVWWGILFTITVIFVIALMAFLKMIGTSKQGIPADKQFTDDDIIELESINVG